MVRLLLASMGIIVLTLPMLRLLLSNAQILYAKIFENLLNLVILVLIGKLLQSNLR